MLDGEENGLWHGRVVIDIPFIPVSEIRARRRSSPNVRSVPAVRVMAAA
jgi:hypothetical protein